MPTSAEALEYLKALNKRTARLGEAVDELFGHEGCSSYVKTIYIGYDIGGEMVAAMYGRGDHLEIALALAEDHPSSVLIDASHLTWKTLPVAAIFHDLSEVEAVRVLVAEACERVRTGQHNVNRDNEFFMKAKRERRGRL